MKKSIIPLIVGILIGGLLFYFIQLQTLKTSKKDVIEPFEKTSYANVADSLDTGGNFYLYLSTEKAMKSIEAFLLDLKSLVVAGAKDQKSPAEDPGKIFDFILSIVRNSGFFAIDGIGMSSISIDEKLDRNVITIHHSGDKGEGKLWTMAGSAPHPLDCLKLLPADTVFASFSDFRLKNLWEWIKGECNQSGIPKLIQGVAMVEPMLLTQGIELQKLLECLNGQPGFIVTLSKEKSVTIPSGDKTVEIPQPSAALLLRTTNDYLFGVLQQKIPGAKLSENGDIKKLEIQLPPLPLPIPLEPQIVQTKDRLIVASNNLILNAIFSAEKKGDGLAATDEFKAMSRGIPTTGNGLRYISPRLSKLVFDMQEKAMLAEGDMSEEVKAMVKKLNPFTKEIGLYGVTRIDDEGFVFEFNHSMSLGNMVMVLPAAMVAGVVAAIAIPSYMGASNKAKQKEFESLK